MIRKFVTAKQADAAEAVTVAIGNCAAAAAGAAETSVPQSVPTMIPMDRRMADRSSGPAPPPVAQLAMKGRGAQEGCSLAEVMAEKRRATAALINGDLDQQLRLAASQGDTGRVHDLVEQGARVLPDKKGRTALHYAALSGYAEVVRMLLDSGLCNVDTVDANGFTALHKAAGNGHLDIIELLIENGKADIDLQDSSNGNTALHEAAWNGYCKTVQLLLSNNSNAYSANKAGCTPLHLAAQNGHNQTTRTLLQAGCSPDVKNNYGDTPLHTATRYGHAGVTRILIRAKCVISEQNNNGDTPLHIAAAFRRRKIARLLMEGGIDWQLRNKQGETAIDTACRKENHEILDIIKSSAARATSIHRHMLQRSELQCDDLMAESSETNDASLDLMAALPTAAAAASADASAAEAGTAVVAAVPNKSKPGLFAWLKEKLSKDKSRKSPQVTGAGGAVTAPELASGTASTWKDPRQRLQRMRGGGGSAGSGSSQSGLFSQYVKHPGMAFYRDLAGNVRQGPAGYVPLYRGGGGGSHLHPTSLLDSCALPPAENGPVAQTFAEGEASAAWRQPEGSGRREGDVPEQVLHFSLRQQQAGHNSGNFGVYAQPQQAAAVGGQSFGRNGGGGDDPFAYTAGVVQRFADDYRQEQCGRYEVSSFFPGRQPATLFRSRSDETLSHSEYSYHGRAFRSREAAAVELRALQERQQLRESRRHRRHGAVATATSAARESPGACGYNGTAERNVNANAESKTSPLALQTSAEEVIGAINPAIRVQSWRRSAEKLDDSVVPISERSGGRRTCTRSAYLDKGDDNGSDRGESSASDSEHDPVQTRFLGGGVTLPRSGTSSARNAAPSVSHGLRNHLGKAGGGHFGRSVNSASRMPSDHLSPAASSVGEFQRSPHDYMNLAAVTPVRSPRGQLLDSCPAATAATATSAATNSYPRGPRLESTVTPSSFVDDCDHGGRKTLQGPLAAGRDLYAELINRRGCGPADQPAAARSATTHDTSASTVNAADQTGRPQFAVRRSFERAPLPVGQHLPLLQQPQVQQRPQNSLALANMPRQNIAATASTSDKVTGGRVGTGGGCERSIEVVGSATRSSVAQPWNGIGSNRALPARPEAGGADGLPTLPSSPPSAPYSPHRDLPPLLLDASIGGLTSPRIEGGSVGSNPDSGYGSKAGETTHSFDEYAAAAGVSPVTDVCRSSANGQPMLRPPPQALDRKAQTSAGGRRVPLPTYESWYSQRLSEAQLQQSTSASKTTRRVVSTFTTDV